MNTHLDLGMPITAHVAQERRIPGGGGAFSGRMTAPP